VEKGKKGQEVLTTKSLLQLGGGKKGKKGPFRLKGQVKGFKKEKKEPLGNLQKPIKRTLCSEKWYATAKEKRVIWGIGAKNVSDLVRNSE